jgi:glycosyltransferase involved in cell wall biosynthesis
MTVVVLADFAYVNGGAGRIALDSAKGLAQRGHRVILFTAVGPLADDLRATPGLTHVCLDQQDVWRDPNRLRAAIHGLWNRTAARRLGEVLSRLEPADTVVHLHSWTKALSSSVVREATSRGFGVVATLHDFLSVCPTGTLFNHQTGACCELAPLSLRCAAARCDSRSQSQKTWRVARQLVQQSIGGLPRRIGHCIAVSATSARLLRRHLPARCSLHVVPNFTEAPFEPPADVAGHAAMLYVGRLSHEKGPLLLADCLARLNVPGVFVGDGDLSDAVRARCAGAELTGWLSPDAVRARMRAARALVLPSLWHETQGLVVAEAAALGLPAIVPDTSAARDWVAHGETGLWFRGGDAASLGAAITTLAAAPALAARMGRAAHDRFWTSPPTLDRHIVELEQIYRVVVDDRLGARSAAPDPGVAVRETW